MYVMSPTHLSPGARAAGVPAHEVGAGARCRRRGAVVRTFRRGCAALSSFSRMTGADCVRRDRHALAVQRGGGRAGTRRIMSEAPSSDSTIRAGFLLLTFVAESGRPSQS